MSTGTCLASPRVSALKWLILVALAWSQLAFAAHQFDHQLGDIGDTCAVCLNFNRDDEGLVDTAHCGSMPPSGTVAPVSAARIVPAAGYTLYRARASP